MTSINTWTPANVNNYWFGSVIRNAIAHSQVHFPSNGGIHLYNQTNQGQINFDIDMTFTDLKKLIKEMLRNFIVRAGPAEGYPPLAGWLN